MRTRNLTLSSNSSPRPYDDDDGDNDDDDDDDNDDDDDDYDDDDYCNTGGTNNFSYSGIQRLVLIITFIDLLPKNSFVRDMILTG